MVSGTENGDRSLALVGKKGGRNFETHNSTVPFFPTSIVYIAHVAPTDRPHDVSDLPDAVGRHEQIAHDSSSVHTRGSFGALAPSGSDDESGAGQGLRASGSQNRKYRCHDEKCRYVAHEVAVIHGIHK